MSAANSGLRLTRSVLRPIRPCRWPDIGAQCCVRIGGKRHLPRLHGAVRVGGRQELPSGLNATPFTLYPMWTWRGAPMGCLVAGFHSRMVPSP